MAQEWRSPVENMMYGVVSCPRKHGDLIAFGKCQQNRSDLCTACKFALVKWFPSEADLSSTYKKTCQKAGHLKMFIIVCKECSVGKEEGSVLGLPLYGMGCFEKGHSPLPEVRCQTCVG